MIDSCYFSHESRHRDSTVYDSCFQRLISFGYPASAPMGENIAGNSTPAGAFDSWRTSTHGHRQNMLDSLWSETGMGVVTGGPYGKMFTNDFGYRPLTFDLSVNSVLVGSYSTGNVKIRALIYQTGSGDCFPVKVSFYNGNPNSGGTLIGDATISAIVRQGYYYAVSIIWNYGKSGEYDVYAKVNSDKHFTETDTTNNLAYKHVKI